MTDPDLVLLAASRSPLAAEVAGRLEAAESTGRSALVAVSGGADSTALLVLALALSRRRTPPVLGEITVGHVDHGLRPESAAESASLQSLADALGITFLSRRLNWTNPAGVASVDARDARWEALGRMADEAGASMVLAGHHADDQAETILLRLTRGVGLSGLGGIRCVRPLDSSVRIVRPLLGVRRKALVDLLTRAGVPWLEDPGNRRGDRGRIRHEVLPVLEDLHAGAAARIAATAEEIRTFSSGAPVGPAELPPEVVRWSRDTIARGERSEVAGRLRIAVGAVPGVDRIRLDAVPRTWWESVAQAVLAAHRDTRRFAVSGVGELVVSADAVELRHQADPAILEPLG